MMVANRLLEVLDKQIKELEAQLDGVRKFREIVANNPSVASVVVAGILDENSNGAFDPSIGIEDKEASPVFVAVLNFFEENQNAWATVGQIAEATQTHRNAIHTLLSMGKHRFMFESKKISTRKKFWRLKFPNSAPADTKGKNSSATKPPPKKTSPEPEKKKEGNRKAPKPKWAPEGEPEYEFDEITGDTKRIK